MVCSVLLSSSGESIHCYQIIKDIVSKTKLEHMTPSLVVENGELFKQKIKP